ncbi:MAG: dTDP-glucose 4,6-dehydratase [Candidatus Abyssobacteria bacterium SURF_5]|uniref:dTDP-glucose 4,6-dehydratase n=1 Tax=Abyssobacteria bacterium (strain SURF_5) TaxID=2093360 RepID=A0A3A4P3R0_ABYX5|nr:MAG: dTDP-glucose 4,6-dehydratase [Candidatus Abyssubacteria bacterium SURF_5]
MRLLVTGGAGFIGSNFVRYMLDKHGDYEIINLDALTYAGNLDNLRDIAKHPRYKFVKADISDAAAVAALAPEVDAIVNFAAETHVDRSIHDPSGFIRTDILGIYVLLEQARRNPMQKIVLVSTDEVYGSIDDGSFHEIDRLNPSSPYSASKAGGELLALAYHKTFGLPICITRGSNTYGPYQYPEKVIPLFVTNALDDLPLPLYGDGMNVRDWLYVFDHCRAIDLVLHEGVPGEIYNVGGGNERTNLEITHMILALLKKPKSLIKPVADRLAHDRRYSITCEKILELGWRPQQPFEEGMRETVAWYAENEWWWRKLKSGEYLEYYRKQYSGGLGSMRGLT